MSLATGDLLLATLTAAITTFPITSLFDVGLRYAFVRPGVHVVRQLLAWVFIRCLATVLWSQCKITLLAHLDGVTILSVLVRDVFYWCRGTANCDRYILTPLALISRLRWMILVRRGDGPVIKIWRRKPVPLVVIHSTLFSRSSLSSWVAWVTLAFRRPDVSRLELSCIWGSTATNAWCVYLVQILLQSLLPL